MEIHLKNIEFSYDRIPVLKGIDARIGKGEFVTLVGPNGSGKSTLIKCLNGILKIRKGAVLLDDHNISTYRSDRLARVMAYVPQSEQKAIPMKVFDAVLLGRKPYISWRPARRDMEVVDEILMRLNLEDVAMKEVQKLSGGQQQRVYIARALAQEPEVLLLDEPTANLDLKHQMEVLDLLRSLTSRGITVIMALHDINLASLYGTRVMMMKEGKIFASGGMEVFTAENIEELYDVKVHMIHENGSVYIIPNRYEIK